MSYSTQSKCLEQNMALIKVAMKSHVLSAGHQANDVILHSLGLTILGPFP